MSENTIELVSKDGENVVRVDEDNRGELNHYKALGFATREQFDAVRAAETATQERAEADAQAKADAEAKAKGEDEARRKAEADAQRKADAEAKAAATRDQNR